MKNKTFQIICAIAVILCSLCFVLGTFHYFDIGYKKPLNTTIKIESICIENTDTVIYLDSSDFTHIILYY